MATLKHQITQRHKDCDVEMMNLENSLESIEPAPAAKDRWFNPDLSPGTPRAHEVVMLIVRTMEQHGRKRALRAEDRQTLHKVLIPLLANLMHHHLSGGLGEGIPVPRSKRGEALGGKGSRYQPPSFSRVRFPRRSMRYVRSGSLNNRLAGTSHGTLRKTSALQFAQARSSLNSSRSMEWVLKTCS
jgi:hypothetical protein